MYTNAVGFAFFLDHANHSNFRRALFATLAFATGAIIGWPFAAAVGIPFVFEELFLHGTDKVAPRERLFWRIKRWRRMAVCVAVASLLLVSVLRFDCGQLLTLCIH